ncbi:GNAT family N-acetyltransferase [Phenylobacterium sp.]|uniref:GNAT family N-acetyltransferase n=1 Tax=Phenylobacterium sp. TaxID=1871053 RepID=UPI00286B10CA|nr:GNAT family N-acetyltransferase [Phenylobacterium sp.]
MPSSFEIIPVRTLDDLRATAALFEAYSASLPVDLGYQDFGAELASLPGKYTPPRGELLLARDAEGQALGCVGLRPLAAEGCCEMKRLYIAPEARGTGLGRALAEAIIQRARDIGHSELRLDTLATMTSAIGLYRQMGFAEIDPYYAPTPPGTIFMALRL